MENIAKSILVVDDVEDVRELLTLVLREEGYEVHTADNGANALTVLNNTHIDLAVTDILMPEMDGIEFITEASIQQPDLKFIIISGGSRTPVSEFDYLSITQKITGVKNVLKKPFNPEDLIHLIEETLSESDT